MAQTAEHVMENARKAFTGSGLSYDELGLRMGYEKSVARKSAWQFVNRTNDPRLSMLSRFADALGVELADLLNNSARA